MTYQEIFNKVKSMTEHLDVSKVKEHIAFQFNITGEGEGAFYIEVKEGQIHVEPYEYYDRDVLFTCSGEMLLKIMSKKADPIVAFTLGKLKVEGNLDKALKLKEFL